MATPEDELFYRVFSDPRHAEGLLRSMLPSLPEDRIAWETLERLPMKFEDPVVGDPFTCLLFRVETRGRPAQLYLLLEHMSAVDRWTALHMLSHVLSVVDRLQEDEPDLPGPPVVVPMVVHSGPQAWHGSTDLLSLFALTEVTRPLLTPFLPTMKYLLLNLADMKPSSSAG